MDIKILISAPEAHCYLLCVGNIRHLIRHQTKEQGIAQFGSNIPHVNDCHDHKLLVLDISTGKPLHFSFHPGSQLLVINSSQLQQLGKITVTFVTIPNANGFLIVQGNRYSPQH